MCWISDAAPHRRHATRRVPHGRAAHLESTHRAPRRDSWARRSRTYANPSTTAIVSKRHSTRIGRFQATRQMLQSLNAVFPPARARAVARDAREALSREWSVVRTPARGSSPRAAPEIRHEEIRAFHPGRRHGRLCRGSAPRRLCSNRRSAATTTCSVRRCPMKENSPYPAWKAEIDSRLAATTGSVALVGHSVGGSVLFVVLVRPATATTHRRPVRHRRAVLGSERVLELGRGGVTRRRSRETGRRLAAHLLSESRRLKSCPSRTWRCTQRSCRAPRSASSTAAGHQFKNDLTEIAADIKS